MTYAPGTAPEGAQVALEVVPGDGSTTATFRVAGMLPDRGYAVHAHVRPCGPTGNDAGPHFQNRVDPAATPQAPSSDPAYANPQNEVWLDLRTDGDGAGTATATVPFAFPDRRPGLGRRAREGDDGDRPGPGRHRGRATGVPHIDLALTAPAASVPAR